MATLYLRNVPEDVRDRLAELARREGMSVSAFAVRELSAASRRSHNANVLAQAPNVDVSIESILESLDAGRRG